MIEVPHTLLSHDALRGVIESFILREGTDYGEHELDLEHKVRQIHEQLKKGDITIVFDESLDSCSIVTRVERDRLKRAAIT